MHEDLCWGTVEEAASRLNSEEPRGEFTVVLAPTAEPVGQRPVDEENLEQAIREMLNAGLSARDTARIVELLTGLSRNEAYDFVQRVRSS